MREWIRIVETEKSIVDEDLETVRSLLSGLGGVPDDLFHQLMLLARLSGKMGLMKASAYIKQMIATGSSGSIQ